MQEILSVLFLSKVLRQNLDFQGALPPGPPYGYNHKRLQFQGVQRTQPHCQVYTNLGLQPPFEVKEFCLPKVCRPTIIFCSNNNKSELQFEYS